MPSEAPPLALRAPTTHRMVCLQPWHPLAAGMIRGPRRGFALVITLALMILLTVIAVGLLTLSSVALRASGQANAMASAQSNARMALMLAIGELQKQLGPDRRISAQAAILDTDPATEAV